VVILDDWRALQCDRCQSGSAWKCSACLSISESTYDALSDEGGSLKWFCNGCERDVVQQGQSDQKVRMNELIRYFSLIEKLINKFEYVEARLAEKANIGIVQKLEDRIKHLEGKFVNGKRIGGGGSVSDKELLECVVKEELRTKLTEDDEIERR